MTAGRECSRCSTDPDISHREEVCWTWERTLPFNPKALSPSHLHLCVPGKRCKRLTSRQPEGLPRPGLPPPAHSTPGEQCGDHEENSNILVNSIVSTKTVPRGLGESCLSASDLRVHDIKSFLLVLHTNTWDYCVASSSVEYSYCALPKVLKTDAALCSRHRV